MQRLCNVFATSFAALQHHHSGTGRKETQNVNVVGTLSLTKARLGAGSAPHETVLVQEKPVLVKRLFNKNAVLMQARSSYFQIVLVSCKGCPLV